MTQKTIPPEFSVETDLAALGKAGKLFRLATDDDQRRKIAERLGVIAVEKLEGEIRLTATRSDIHAAGIVKASLRRECVASLEPMTENIDEKFEISFIRQAPTETEGANEESEDWMLAEVHEGDVFDVGELLVQQLSLAMAPFPRKPGAASLAEQYGQSGSVSPFGDLQAVLEKGQKKQ